MSSESGTITWSDDDNAGDHSSSSIVSLTAYMTNNPAEEQFDTTKRNSILSNEIP